MQTLGIITPFLWGVFLGDIHTALVRSAREWGFRLVFIRAGNWSRSYESLLSTGLCDAWINILDGIGPVLTGSLVASGRPVCSLFHHPSAPGGSTVRCDNRQGIVLAMEDLSRSGHRRFAFLGDDSNSDMAERSEAFREFHRLRGWDLNEAALVVTPGTSFSSGWEKAGILEAGGCPFTALVAANDQLAFGAQGYFQDLGVKIPEERVLVGFDNSSVCLDAEPTLSSIDPMVVEQIQAAFGELRRRVDDPASPPSEIRISPQLRLRASTRNGNPAEKPEKPAALPDRLIWGTLAFENEVNRVQWGHGTLESLRLLLSLLKQKGRQAQFAEIRGHECLVGDSPSTVPLTLFGGALLALDDHDPVFVLPCLTGALPTHALVVSVPMAQVLDSQTLGLVSHELELTAMAVERSSVREQLALQVKERTKHLEEALDQLHKAQRESLESERLATVGRVAARVAHEVNTPLAAIVSANSTVQGVVDDLVSRWIPFFHSLDEDGYRGLVVLASRLASPCEPRAFRHRKSVWTRYLKEESRDEPELAELLAETGLETVEEGWAFLLKRPDRLEIFRCAVMLSDVSRSVSGIDQAAFKVSEAIQSLRPPGAALP